MALVEATAGILVCDGFENASTNLIAEIEPHNAKIMSLVRAAQ